MDYQVIFNIALGLIGTLGGWFFKSVYDQIRNVEQEVEDVADHHERDHREVVQRINDLALSLPEKYASRGDFDTLSKTMHHRFDKLEEKIDALKK